MKRGIYNTSYGNAALVLGPKAKTAFDLDMIEEIPISEVDESAFIREVEEYDIEESEKSAE